MARPKKFKPTILYDNAGNSRGVLLTVKDFETLVEMLEDYHDYKLLKTLKPVDFRDVIPLEVVEKRLFGKKR